MTWLSIEHTEIGLRKVKVSCYERMETWNMAYLVSQMSCKVVRRQLVGRDERVLDQELGPLVEQALYVVLSIICRPLCSS
jgi:hypothetical protein